jgi:hypothetical protein
MEKVADSMTSRAVGTGGLGWRLLNTRVYWQLQGIESTDEVRQRV